MASDTHDPRSGLQGDGGPEFELSESSQGLFGVARRVRTPPAHAFERVYARTMEAASGTVVATAPGASIASAGAARFVTTKVVLPVVVAGIAGSLLWWSLSRGQVPPAVHVSLPRPTQAEPPRETALRANDDPTINVHDLPTTESAKARPTTASAALPSNAAKELAHLKRVHSALSDGDAARTLALVVSYEEKYPRGMFTEEIEGSRVLALCVSGRESEARVAQRSFLAAHPSSALRARVEAACVDNRPTPVTGVR